jgi:hypothetical protein
MAVPQPVQQRRWVDEEDDDDFAIPAGMRARQ